jgi:hypothetical protein
VRTRGSHGRLGCRLAAALALAAAVGCAPPIPGRAQLIRNPRAEISGVVLDSVTRLPEARLRVWAIPHSKAVPWPDAATTDDEGRFRLTVYAPADYSFMFERGGRTVITSRPGDASLQILHVAPGQRIDNVRLIFFRDAFENVD